MLFIQKTKTKPACRCWIKQDEFSNAGKMMSRSKQVVEVEQRRERKDWMR